MSPETPSPAPSTPPNPGPQPGYAAPRTPSRAGCVVAVGLALLLGCLAFGVMVLLSGMIGQGMGSTANQLVEQEVESGAHTTTNKILRLKIHGVIMGDEKSVFGMGQGADGWETIRKYLDNARQDPAIKGILLDVDSPGGSVTECELILHEFKRFKDDMKKVGRSVPMVALYGDMAASGGYYVSAGADYIYCGRTTMTGSIGVIMSYLNFAGFAKEHGVTEVVIKSGKMKNLMSRYGTPSEEETGLMQNVVQEMHARFVEVIAEGRVGKNGLTKEKIETLADGRVYTPSQALEHGLVDQIGYYDDAVAKLKTLAGLADARVVEYQRVRGLLSALTGSAALNPPRSLAEELQSAVRYDAPRMMYLWSAR